MRITVDSEPTDASVAEYLQLDLDALADRERFLPPIGRWLSYEGERAVGLATAWVRPDDRVFVTHRLDSEAAFGPLLAVAVAQVDERIHLSVTDDHPARRRIAEEAGFVVDLQARSYDVPFEGVLRHTAGGKSDRIELLPADRVAPDELYRLDVDLRQDIPGNDGWRGNRVWFEDEMSSEEFDPAAYLVARDCEHGGLVGLCRMWRNQTGPTLGMLGVRPSHRTGRPARTLLHATALAASTWGFDSFAANTARRPLQRRLQRLGASETGGFTRLQRTPTSMSRS